MTTFTYSTLHAAPRHRPTTGNRWDVDEPALAIARLDDDPWRSPDRLVVDPEEDTRERIRKRVQKSSEEHAPPSRPTSAAASSSPTTRASASCAGTTAGARPEVVRA